MCLDSSTTLLLRCYTSSQTRFHSQIISMRKRMRRAAVWINFVSTSLIEKEISIVRILICSTTWQNNTRRGGTAWLMRSFIVYNFVDCCCLPIGHTNAFMVTALPTLLPVHLSKSNHWKTAALRRTFHMEKQQLLVQQQVEIVWKQLCIYIQTLPLSPPLLVQSCLFIFFSDVGNAHIWMEPVHLVSR